MERARTAIQWITAAGMGLWHALPELTQLLILLMVADTILGTAVAWRNRDLSSAVAWRGATKKLGSLLLIGVAAWLNPHVQDFVEINLVQAASAFYIVPELASIAKNAAYLDIPVFVQFKSVMRYFQAASGEVEPDKLESHSTQSRD